MNRLEKERRETDRFIGTINSAYDLTSCGMGVQLNAVDLLGQGKDLPAWAEEALSFQGSNYIGTVYYNTWKQRKDEYWKKFAPKHYCPHTKKHLKLIDAMHEEYSGLERKFPYSYSYYETEEEKEAIFAILQEQEKFQPIVQSFYTHKEECLKKGWWHPKLDRELEWQVFYIAKMEMERVVRGEIYGEQFEKAYLKMAIHKLGAMLGLTDQLAYDAMMSGCPIPANYIPEDFSVFSGEKWREMFGEEVPTIEKLYRKAYEVFVKYADPNDSLVIHLFDLPPEKIHFARSNSTSVKVEP